MQRYKISFLSYLSCLVFFPFIIVILYVLWCHLPTKCSQNIFSDWDHVSSYQKSQAIALISFSRLQRLYQFLVPCSRPYHIWTVFCCATSGTGEIFTGLAIEFFIWTISESGKIWWGNGYTKKNCRQNSPTFWIIRFTFGSALCHIKLFCRHIYAHYNAYANWLCFSVTQAVVGWKWCQELFVELVDLFKWFSFHLLFFCYVMQVFSWVKFLRFCRLSIILLILQKCVIIYFILCWFVAWSRDISPS